MWTLLNPRVLVGCALAALLSFATFTVYRAGAASVRSKWDADIALRTTASLRVSEANRATEQALQLKNVSISNELIKAKANRASDAVIAAGKLRDLNAALDSLTSSDSGATAGADDPAIAVARQCATSLVLLDEYAQNLASQTRGLQDYARDVCVSAVTDRQPATKVTK